MLGGILPREDFARAVDVLRDDAAMAMRRKV
jgi:hypothetical protein